MKLLASNAWHKVFVENGEKYQIIVQSQLVHRDENSSPYFSIGGDIFRLARNGRKPWVAGGCIHDEIIKHFPQLQPLVDIHLSDDNGVPVHAYFNAAYWAGHQGRSDKNTYILAKHLRVSEEQANEMTTYITHHYGEFDKITTPEQAWENTCKDFDLLEHWYQQAQIAIALLNKVEETK
jgi:hypothetical protein